MTPPPPRSTLFPYTTLFRSRGRGHVLVVVEAIEIVGRERRSRDHESAGIGDATLGRIERRARIRARQLAEIARLRVRSEEHTSELQSQFHLVCRLLLEKKK